MLINDDTNAHLRCDVLLIGSYVTVADFHSKLHGMHGCVEQVLFNNIVVVRMVTTINGVYFKADNLVKFARVQLVPDTGH